MLKLEINHTMERKTMKTTVKIARLLSLVAFTASAFTGFALSVKNPSISMEQMSKDADEIVIGNVLSVEPAANGGALETRYQIEIHENLKSKSGDMVPGKAMMFTLPGAALTSPPITQYVSGVPYLAKGEEVLLFLRNGKPQPAQTGRTATQPKSLLSASPKIIGWNQGRFSVLTNPSNGRKMVARINLENYGLMNSSKAMSQILDAVEAEQLPLIEQQVARSADIASEARVKDPLELTTADNKKLEIDRSLQKGAAMQAIRQRGGIAAQYLDEFKAQIQTYVNESN